MLRRTRLALLCAALSLTTATACTGPPPGPAAGEHPAPVELPADDETRAAKAAGEEHAAPAQPPDDGAPVAPPSAAPADIASVLGPGTDITTTPLEAERVREIRSGPDVQGAFDTAVLLLVAWREAMTTADASVLRSLALESCSWCASVAQSASVAPLRPEGGYRLTFTVWPLTDSLTSTGGTVSVALESVVVLEGTADGLAVGEELSVDQVVVDVTVERSPDGWAIAGVRTGPWTAAHG